MKSTPDPQVVLVDDDVFSLKLLTRTLEQIGYNRISAHERSNDALTMIRKAPLAFQLVIADLQMPEMDGIQFLRQLSTTGYSGAILLISGEDRRILQAGERLATLYGLRVLGSLQKPVTIGALKQFLQNRDLGPVWRPPKMPTPRFSGDDLKAAMDECEIAVFYQPQVSVEDGVLIGVEAVARWRHPHGGVLPAAQFVKAVEAHGHSRLLDSYILTQVLLQKKKWEQEHFDLAIAINMHMESVSNLDFLDQIANAAADVDTSTLTIELTESQCVNNPAASLEAITRLGLMGFSFSIDDFGIGNSTLIKLRDIPFSELKIDGNFVRSAGHKGETVPQAIVESIVSLGHRLGMRVVAKGVENRADWDYVAAIGCDVVQGFFVGKAMPAEELPDWLSTWNARRRDLLRANGDL